LLPTTPGVWLRDEPILVTGCMYQVSGHPQVVLLLPAGSLLPLPATCNRYRII